MSSPRPKGLRPSVVAAHEALAELLVDESKLRVWSADPAGYARSRLDRPGAAMLANLDPARVAEAAVHQGRKAGGKDVHRRREEEHRARARPSPPSPSPRRHERRHRPRSSPPLVGLTYRPRLFYRFFAHLGLVDVWEHTVDSYLDGGDEALRAMDVFAGGTPVSLHSVDLSLGSPEARDPQHLRRVRAVIEASGVGEISDHLAFSRTGPHRLGHFAPLWRVEEFLELTAANVEHVQDALGVRLALENITLTFDPGGDISTAEFLNELTRRTGCGVHLDITNLTINAANVFCDAAGELATLDLASVLSVHVAGGIEKDGMVRDAHAFPVPDSDIEWLRRLLPHIPNCRSVVVERDWRHAASEEVADDLRRLHAAVDRALDAVPA